AQLLLHLLLRRAVHGPALALPTVVVPQRERTDPGAVRPLVDSPFTSPASSSCHVLPPRLLEPTLDLLHVSGQCFGDLFRRFSLSSQCSCLLLARPVRPAAAALATIELVRPYCVRRHREPLSACGTCPVLRVAADGQGELEPHGAQQALRRKM